jgi:thymidylate kinase
MMEDNEKIDRDRDRDRDKEEIFSRTVRAGKRTYFFDVKATIAEERYLTITESKRRFNNEQGKFFYEKHKLFLYHEDFEKFVNGLNDAIEFIQTGKAPERPEAEIEEKPFTTETHETNIHDISFDDLNTDSEVN